MRASNWVCLTLALLVTAPHDASAQLRMLLREGLEAAAYGSAKAATKGAQEGVERVAPTVSNVMRQGVTEVAADVATASSAASRQVLKASVKHADDVCRPVVAQFGDEGAKALASLSQESGVQLAQLAPDLARNPRGAEWLATIATHGDAAVAWLWQRKASIAVGTTATAVLLRPEAFLEASEQIATTAIATTGQHVMQPLIAESAQHVAEPLVREVTRPVMALLAPAIAFSVAASLVYWRGRKFWQRTTAKPVADSSTA